jgi:hypothetical protein
MFTNLVCDAPITKSAPIFSDDTVNSGPHCEAVLNPFIRHLNEDEIARGYYQQAGATAHTALFPLRYCAVFRDRRVSKENWPPRSPDFTHLDYYLWGAMKGAV